MKILLHYFKLIITEQWNMPLFCEKLKTTSLLESYLQVSDISMSYHIADVRFLIKSLMIDTLSIETDGKMDCPLKTGYTVTHFFGLYSKIFKRFIQLICES
jgi:hypothetical protein